MGNDSILEQAESTGNEITTISKKIDQVQN